MRKDSELTIRKQKDFNRIYSKGKSRGSRFVVIIYKRNGLDHTRTAFVSSKKVGNSVRRNHSRRLMREAYRSMSDRIESGWDIVFVARNTINDAIENDVERSMFGTLRSCGLIEDSGRRDNI